MYIIGYYDVASHQIEFSESCFFSETGAAEGMEELFETVTGKDINIGNITSNPVNVVDELYQYTVERQEDAKVMTSTTIKFFTRLKSKGYIYNTFTDFILEYTFFIKKTPSPKKNIGVSTYVSVLESSIEKNTKSSIAIKASNDTRNKLLEELKEKLMSRSSSSGSGSGSVYEAQGASGVCQEPKSLYEFPVGTGMWTSDQLDNHDYIDKYLRKRRRRIRTRNKKFFGKSVDQTVLAHHRKLKNKED